MEDVNDEVPDSAASVTRGVRFADEPCVQEFTDEDFNYGAEQFDVDYLEGIPSEASADPQELSRKSLFVKFDPLVSSADAKSAAPSAARLAEINERENVFSPVDKPKKKKPAVSFASDLLVMDTPPKQALQRPTPTQDLAPASVPSPVSLLSDITPMATQSTNEKMYSEEEVARMVEDVKREEIEKVAKKYEPELAALEEELSSLEAGGNVEEGGGGAGGEEFQLVDVILSSEQSLLAQERDKWKLLVAEHERLEVLLEYYHEKLKEKFLSLAENRDSTLKSDKIKAKSFEDLQQRYQQLQAAARKLYKAQGNLAMFKKKAKETSESLNVLSEECLLKQDELNQSYESLQKELMSKTAAERALSKTLELQVATLEKNVKQKEHETKQLTQIAHELMQKM